MSEQISIIGDAHVPVPVGASSEVIDNTLQKHYDAQKQFDNSRSLNNTPPNSRPNTMASTAGPGMPDISGVGSALIGGLTNIASSAITAGAMRDVAETSAQASRYGADQNLAGTKYQTDIASQNFSKYLSQQFTMWDRDYKVANQLGLYHPSQLGTLNQPAATDIYKLGVGSLARMPKTFKRSLLTI